MRERFLFVRLIGGPRASKGYGYSTRNHEPTAPTWDNRSAEWITSEDPDAPVWEYVWNWYRGVPTQGINRAVDDTDALVQTLRSMDDAEAIGAAYTLGNIGALDYLMTVRWDDAPWSGEHWEYDLQRAPTRDRHPLLNSWDS